ncbi:hypothetical protein [Nonomuraea sp. NPDC046570]|uniref:hypothetical protein n=1 Tax=Nonomuraea sp. NPDC046570 TaxID=3155255 RepID=UPI00340EFFA2
MTESGHEQHAGDMGAHRATLGEPTDPESINVAPTRPGAKENALADETSRRPHEEFVPEAPIPAYWSGDNEYEEHDVDRNSETGKDLGEVKDKAEEMASVVKHRTSETAEVAKHRASETAAAARNKAGDVVTVAKDKAGEMADKVRDATPDQVKDAADQVAGEAKKRPMLAIAAAGAVVLLIARRLMRRRGK